MSTMSSRSSSVSTILALKKAEAEAAKVRVAYAERQAAVLREKANMTKKQSLLDAELSVMKAEQEADVVKVEAETLERLNNTEVPELTEELPDNKVDPHEHLQRYFESNVESQTLNPHSAEFKPIFTTKTTALDNQQNATFNQHLQQDYDDHRDTQDMGLSRFLIKKELMASRITTFNDKPESYRAWKKCFHSVLRDMCASADEEIDLLIKYLGADSKRHAISLRSVYTINPEQACRKVWQRLDDRYGSPELVKSSIMAKLNDFPRINGRNMSQLYDLADVLSEVDALKNDPRCSQQLSYFDSSEGVLPIMHKLPYNIQEKWVTRASTYKKVHGGMFPPFSKFVEFVEEVATMKNDPALICMSNEKQTAKSQKTDPLFCKKTDVSTEGKPVTVTVRCPIHKANHSLPLCRGFKDKSIEERQKIVKDHKLCFKCLESTEHKASQCKKNIKCSICNSERHISLMHVPKQEKPVSFSLPDHGGEKVESNPVSIGNMCTSVCGKIPGGKSCAKIVLIDIFCSSTSNDREPLNKVRAYAIIDDQSNRSLAKPELFTKLNIDGPAANYTLNSCSGSSNMKGRKALNCTIKSVKGDYSCQLPPLLECAQIPNARDEIPTKEIAAQFEHLKQICPQIPAFDENAEILLLIGRDVGALHHVHEQIIGPPNAPFAQRLNLGWVIIGQVCLGKIHQTDSVNCNKTYLLSDGRASHFPPCTSNLKTVESFNQTPIPSVESDLDHLFIQTKNDNKVGLSIEDREFLSLMENNMKRDSSGHWIAPLPFRKPRPRLPNNRSHAYHRALLLHKSLMNDPKKREHFVTFMDQIISRGHAEIAPQLSDTDECWYLPLFGVYHPKKPDQIRGVFDASAKFKGTSLNDVLLQGPDYINNLVGILLRFRKHPVAVSADIQQMFYSFLVSPEDRNYLRFFWYKENDPSKDLVEFRMRVHVFGNRPSPAVANLGLKKTAEISTLEFGREVTDFVSNNFYVDDGLISTATAEQAIDLMKNTQSALSSNGNLRLHKIASNCKEVMASFPVEDLAKDLANLDLSKDEMPLQRSLGLLWNVNTDSFTFHVSNIDKPFTRRGVLSVVNSLYDPLGIVAPVTIIGKILLKSMTTENIDWDTPLSERYLPSWCDWTKSLHDLQNVHMPRCYFSPNTHSATYTYDLLLFSDASEKAIASVAYIVRRRFDNTDGENLSDYKILSDNEIPTEVKNPSDFKNPSDDEISFVMGKTKVAPSKGHTIPRLELCAALLSVELAEFILEHLDVRFENVWFFTDSKVVLGYISNKTRRFYTYVSNRVHRILESSKPMQWKYIDTKRNPADVGSRGIPTSEIGNSMWLKGPPKGVYCNIYEDSAHSLQSPTEDQELRPEVIAMTTILSPQEDSVIALQSNRFERFSCWKSVTKAVSILQHISKSFKKSNSCSHSGWHICQESTHLSNQLLAQDLIIKIYQLERFKSEIKNLENGKPLAQNSSILSLNPFLDEKGVLRVGGRLKHSNIPSPQKNPVIIVGNSHLATLLIRHHHEKVLHQGRHFTEGAIRAAGYWLIGGKRQIASIIFKCFTCRRLRGKLQNQIMANLPVDRVNPAPPFSYVGVDVFGPWSVVTRRTRGGEASSKRWGVLFTCLSIRAVHVEVVSEMSSSAFINALRRFISLRGNIVEIRSDRGTNFVGSCEDLGIDTVNVGDSTCKEFFEEKQVRWIFNPPHSSHMGGVWERMIGVVRKILDSLLLNCKNLTHDVLVTFMAEVTAIVNARPLVPVSSDCEQPEILSPSVLLTQKSNPPTSFNDNLTLKDIYRSEWKRVQVLSDQFWCRWRSEFLSMLQTRRKWMRNLPNLKVGDVVLLKDDTVCRNQWPLAVITEVYPGSDSKVRKVKLRVTKDGKPSLFVRPVHEVVLLLDE